MKFSEAQLRWFRLKRSGLVTPFSSPESASSALIGVQAQILPAAGIALWHRTRNLTHARFDALLHQDRTLVKLWGQRGTLHVYKSEEWPFIHAMMSRDFMWWERIADGDRETFEKAVIELEAMLRANSTLGRSDVRAAKHLELDDAHLSSWGGIFAALVQRGIACHAGSRRGEGRFAHRENWLPALVWNPPDGESTNVEIFRRFLAAYGPASVQDFAYWRLVTVRDASRWAAKLADEIVEIDLDGHRMLLLRADLDDFAATPPPVEAWPIRLLYRFDPLLLFSKDKTWLVPPEFYKRIWRPAGHVEGSLLAGGQLIGAWRYERAGKGLVVTLAPFASLPQHIHDAVKIQAADIAGFFGLPLADLRLV